MKIVIATPPGILDNGKHVMLFPSRCDWVGEFAPGTQYYPYELAYLSALLKRETDHEVVMLDGCVNQTDPDTYTQQIAELSPDLLITECGHLTYPTMTRIMQEVNPPQRIITGPYASRFPLQASDDGWQVIEGEYEAQIYNLLTGNEIPERVDLDWLPLPEDEDLNRLDYFDEACIDRGVIQAYATRGCPMACDFCIAPIYYGGHKFSRSSHRVRQPDLICDEIEHLANKYGDGFTGVFWNDETHNGNKRWLAEFAGTLIERNLNGYHYDAMCGYWGWSEELVALIARAGYKQLRIGFETLDEMVSSGIGKRVVPGKLRQLLVWLRHYGIRAHGTVMIGLPGSTRVTDMRTLELLLDMKADGLWNTCQHSPATPNPGTPFYWQAKREGWLTTDKLEDYHWRNVVLSYPDYSREQIEEVRQAYYLLRANVRRENDLLLVRG